MGLLATLGPVRPRLCCWKGSGGWSTGGQALFNACTSHYYARHPMPDPSRWAAITDPHERLRAALADLYSWYGETEEMLAPGIRDIEHVPAGSREAFLGYFQTVHVALMAGRRERGRTRLRIAGAIGHAINFHTWHSLVREQQLSADEAITLMTATVHAATQATPGPPPQTRNATPRSRSRSRS